MVQSEKARIKHARRKRLFAVLYNLVCIAEIVYFIVGLYIVDWQVADLRDNILVGYMAEGLTELGGLHPGRIMDQHQYWRLLTALFLPAGAIQLMTCLSLLWVFGSFLSREFHPWTVAAFFMLSGLGGAIFSANVATDNVTSSASIPAFGLAGAACAVLVGRAGKFTHHMATAAVVCALLALNTFVGATPFVDNAGNTMGFVLGVLLAVCPMCVWRQQADTRAGERLVQACAVLAGAFVLCAGILGLVGLQLDAPIGGCCNEWVCTSSPWWNCEASRIWPSDCTYVGFYNGSGTITCPRGTKVYLPQFNASASSAQLEQWCSTYCTYYGPPSGQPGGSPGNNEQSTS